MPMLKWPTLSEKYQAPNGMFVEPVGSEEQTQELGRFFNNGLQVSSPMNPYPGRCVRGQAQIFAIRDSNSDLVANGMLEVNAGRVFLSFLREHQNSEIPPGHPARVAAEAYVDAVNRKDLGLAIMHLSIGPDGFTEAPAVTEDLPAWQKALREARARFITPFMALITGEPEEKPEPVHLDPNADPVADRTWMPLTGAWTQNGITIEPVSSMRGLRVLGERVDDNLQVMLDAAADGCENGRTQYAAIYTEADGIIGVAEFRPVHGIIVPNCRGKYNEDPSPEVAAAVRAYTAAVIGGAVPTNFPVGAANFLLNQENAATADVFAGRHIDVGPLLPAASRTGGGWYDGDGEGDDPEYPEDQDMSWTPITDDYPVHGLTVQVVSDEDTLASMGEAFHNALETMHRNWAEDCAEGRSQIILISAEDGEMVANAEIKVRDGLVYSPHGALANHNAPAPENARMALEAWMDAVNSKAIDLRGTITDDGFDFDANPRPIL